VAYLIGPLDVELNLLAGERADPVWLVGVVSVAVLMTRRALT
jgi:hypothetical protein